MKQIIIDSLIMFIIAIPLAYAILGFMGVL